MESLGVSGKEPVHFFGGFQVAVGGTLALEADVIDRAAFANAGQDVLENAAVRMMEEHVVGHDGLHSDLDGELG